MNSKVLLLQLWVYKLMNLLSTLCLDSFNCSIMLCFLGNITLKLPSKTRTVVCLNVSSHRAHVGIVTVVPESVERVIY